MDVSARPPSKAVDFIPNANVTSKVVLKLGTIYLWGNVSGSLYIGTANPSSDMDGTVVGDQT